MAADRHPFLLAFVLAALGLFALASGWLAQRWQGSTQPPRAVDIHRPDYVIDGLRALELDIHGQPKRRLTAMQLRHYPHDDSNALDQPRLLLYDDQAPPWHIRADQGWSASGNARILLTGEVRARRAAGANDPAMAFATSAIEIFPDQEYAQTDRFIEIERGPDRMTAIQGMRFWYIAPMRGEFFGRVRSRVATKNAPERGPQPPNAHGLGHPGG